MFSAFSLLEELDMELLYVRNFAEAIPEWLVPGRSLLEQMKGLETFPNRNLSGKTDEEYLEAKAKIEGLAEGQPKYVGTLSKSEWEAICMYLVFAFRKKTPEKPSEEKPEAVETEKVVEEKPASSSQKSDSSEEKPAVKKAKVEQLTEKGGNESEDQA